LTFEIIDAKVHTTNYIARHHSGTNGLYCSTVALALRIDLQGAPIKDHGI